MLFYSLKRRFKNDKMVLLALFCLFIALFSACGKRKPPLPPTEKVSQRLEIEGIQQGNKILLSWTMPVRNAGRGNILRIDRIDVYRLAEPLASNSGISEDEFASRGTLIDSVKVTDDDFARKRMTYTDELTFAAQPVRLRYAVRLANDGGQKAGFSNFIVVEPNSKVPVPPDDLKSTVSQSAVTISWNSPSRNIDGSAPANVLGFNVYRAVAGSVPVMLNKEPVRVNEFRDEAFVFNAEYAYFVRSIAVAGDDPVESVDSVIIGVQPKDVFPPAAPAALTIAASPSTISLFFATNLEPDVVSYRIYRSEDPSLPEKSWTKLTPTGMNTNTFLDTDVKPGRKYFYFVTAVDKFGNESARSDIASDTVPN